MWAENIWPGLLSGQKMPELGWAPVKSALVLSPTPSLLSPLRPADCFAGLCNRLRDFRFSLSKYLNELSVLLKRTPVLTQASQEGR